MAWKPLGWRCAFVSEIEKFPCAVLSHHYPEVPNMGDLTRYKEWKHEPIDLLVGGTPCQSFSVAGLRKGLDDPRGNLALVFWGLVERARPRWVVWENVPGVLSSKRGRDFGAFLGALGQLGYGWSYRVLDAQYFGLAQRRKRVFVVGHLGGWQRSAAVLLEPESLRGDPAPSREAGARVAGTVEARTCRSVGAEEAANGHLTVAIQDVRGLDKAQNGSGIGGDLAYTLDAHATQGVANLHDHRVYVKTKNAQTPEDHETWIDGAHQPGRTLAPFGPDPHMVVGFHTNARPDEMVGADNISSTLTKSQVAGVAGVGVRRLTPRECERLQGFPDDYTLIRLTKRQRAEVADDMVAYYRRTGQEWAIEDMLHFSSDSPRYRALGNSMAVPVMRWIGERIQAVEDIP